MASRVMSTLLGPYGNKRRTGNKNQLGLAEVIGMANGEGAQLSGGGITENRGHDHEVVLI